KERRKRSNKTRRCWRSISRHERHFTMSALAAESPTPVPVDSAEPLIRVEDVHTYYGKSHILHGVSLSVRPGEVVGLLGRNGVGKSTTLKSIMGLVRPSHGTVMLNGNAI